jgi:hypothetical protein
MGGNCPRVAIVHGAIVLDPTWSHVSPVEGEKPYFYIDRRIL